MRTAFFISILLLGFISVHSQGLRYSPAYYPVENEYPVKWVPVSLTEYEPHVRATWWERNKKSFAILGIEMSSLALEASGDALFDLGKIEGDRNKMQWGHTLQAAGYGVLALALPMIDWRFPVADGMTVFASYMTLRYGSFDYMYNTVRGLPLGYIGTTATVDNVLRKQPEAMVHLSKGLSFSLGIVILFKEY